jgi:hypothetical protein
MGLLTTMKNLDSRVVPGFRRPGEPAEAFLRRASALPWFLAGNPWEYRTALREYFAELDRRA